MGRLSIFAFAKKDPKYLAALARDDSRFVTYPLSINHRCHPSIINYSLRLMSPASRLLHTDEIRVYEKRVDGSEIEIAHWLSAAVPRIADYFDIDRLSAVGILFRGARTGNIVHRNLSIPHKPVITTPLDTETSLWGALFKKVLNLVFSRELTKYELVEEYLRIDLQLAAVRNVMKLLRMIEKRAQIDLRQLQQCHDSFIEIAKIVLPSSRNDRAVDNLLRVLSSEHFLDSFVPPAKEKVQLLTFHKAKGLEFDVVFHLDLYRFILPQYMCSPDEYIQYMNLHYVAITRAKACCVLCTSSERHRSNQQRCGAEGSEFLHTNDLESLRALCPF